MYYGLAEHDRTCPATTPAQALTQQTDFQVGGALIAALSPHVTASMSEDGTKLVYSVELCLSGWWGVGEADTLEQAMQAALWDIVNQPHLKRENERLK